VHPYTAVGQITNQLKLLGVKLQWFIDPCVPLS